MILTDQVKTDIKAFISEKEKEISKLECEIITRSLNQILTKEYQCKLLISIGSHKSEIIKRLETILD